MLNLEFENFRIIKIFLPIISVLSGIFL